MLTDNHQIHVAAMEGQILDRVTLDGPPFGTEAGFAGLVRKQFFRLFLVFTNRLRLDPDDFIHHAGRGKFRNLWRRAQIKPDQMGIMGLGQIDRHLKTRPTGIALIQMNQNILDRHLSISRVSVGRDATIC